MPIKPAVKTVWLLIAATFIIGLGLAGLGFALGGNAPIGFGPGGMNFIDIRSGARYNARMEAFTTDEDPRQGVITEPIDAITITSLADVRIIPTDRTDISYEIRTENSARHGYAVSTVHGVFDISPYDDRTFLGIGTFGLGGFGFPNQSSEIIIEVPQEAIFNSINVFSISGSITTGTLRANNIDLASIAGSIDVDGIGDADNFTNRLELGSVSGRITIMQAYVNRLGLSQVSGSTDIELADLENFRFDASTVGASVTVDGSNLISGIATSERSFGDGSRNAHINTVSGSVNLHAIDAGILPDEPVEDLDE